MPNAQKLKAKVLIPGTNQNLKSNRVAAEPGKACNPCQGGKTCKRCRAGDIMLAVPSAGKRVTGAKAGKRVTGVARGKATSKPRNISLIG